MDKKIYERTRYQNIYRHKKNKNYIVMMSKPVKTSISKIDNRKIITIEEAIKLRDNYRKKQELALNSINSNLFNILWNKYIDYCKNISKLSYNTLKKKERLYKKYICYFDNYKVNKILRDDIVNFINDIKTTDKQKNEILIIIKGFFNWCVSQEILVKAPSYAIKSIKVNKPEMKYWLPGDYKKFMQYIDSLGTPTSHMIKTLVLLGFILGDRIGETRALTWDRINEEHQTIELFHSINYDPNSKDYLSSTKNYQSERTIDVSSKLIEELKKYKKYVYNLYNELNPIIFYNYKTKRPYSDTHLREMFKEYSRNANVPVIRLYDLRHTYVTLMMSEGWELYHISKRLGHKNYATTVDKYGHIEGKIRKEIAKTTDKYM